MAKLQTYFYSVLLGAAMLTVAYVFMFYALRYTRRAWQAGEDRVTLLVVLGVVMGIGGFFTIAVVGVTISIVLGTHAILPT
ncbi:MAG: hypothetical protein J2P57_06570 [Acidimicrobiaceae bacterium]|nr:hypothetical protein [Acidimicrobiaceae bacterium]MBO0760910.1 hypothetical protein [Candidatus Dormibacteraeota bacterium]